jgi:hypothetical protein
MPKKYGGVTVGMPWIMAEILIFLKAFLSSFEMY